MAKGKKKEGKARKAEARGREKGRRRGGALDQRQLASFADELRLHGFALHPVARDGNCFFRSLADQLDSQQQRYDDYRQRVVAYMEAHEDDYAPFLTFGEGDEEDDRDFHEYTARMRRDGEWAGQPELLAAARALDVDIVVHQHEMPSYRLSCGKAHARCIHLSYHNGEHYNSVHPLSPAPRAASEKVDVAEELASPSELSVLQGSGCSDLKAARAALRRSDHDVESAIEWLASGLADATLAQGEADQPEEESGAGPSAATEEEEEKEGEKTLSGETSENVGEQQLNGKPKRMTKADRRRAKEEKRARAASRHKHAAMPSALERIEMNTGTAVADWEQSLIAM